jgi:hypothetical protein
VISGVYIKMTRAKTIKIGGYKEQQTRMPNF